MKFGYYDNDMSGWGWSAMSVGMILFWGVVAAAIVLLVRSLNSGDRSGWVPSAVTPQQLFAERFARGDIEDSEYHNRLATFTAKARS